MVGSDARQLWVGAAIALAIVLAGAAGCGDDSGGGDAGEPEPMGEPCQAGLTDTNCFCGATRGVRYCSADGIWGECMCRALTDAGQPVCREGQRVICNPCGSSDRWETLCKADGTYDCSCDSADAPRADAGP